MNDVPSPLLELMIEARVRELRHDVDHRTLLNDARDRRRSRPSLLTRWRNVMCGFGGLLAWLVACHDARAREPRGLAR